MFPLNCTLSFARFQQANCASEMPYKLRRLSQSTALSNKRAVVTAAALSLLSSSPVWAGDARSIALGGSVIANGQGVHGAVENPASLMAMQRRNENIHVRFGMSIEVRDAGEAIDTLSDEDNENLVDDLDTQIDILSSEPVQCDPIFGNGADICVENTQGVADVSTQVLEILDTVDGETIDGQAHMDLGVAFTATTYPVAINLKGSATVFADSDISDSDRDYITEFQTVLTADENGVDALTLEEAQTASFLEVNALGASLSVQQPDEVLNSEFYGAAIARAQLGISLASSFQAGDYLIDAGVTPKFSTLTAYDIDVRLNEEFDDNTDTLQNRLEDSEVSESSFTFDLGASTALKQYPVRLATVLRNVVSESITTENDFTFKTTPQLVFGALYQEGMLSVTGDVALNEAKVDNFKTQKIGLGIEYGTTKLAIRGGINTDLARDSDATSLSLGVGLGPLQIGARLAGLEALEAGAQLSYSF